MGNTPNLFMLFSCFKKLCQIYTAWERHQISLLSMGKTPNTSTQHVKNTESILTFQLFLKLSSLPSKGKTPNLFMLFSCFKKLCLVFKAWERHQIYSCFTFISNIVSSLPSMDKTPNKSTQHGKDTKSIHVLHLFQKLCQVYPAWTRHQISLHSMGKTPNLFMFYIYFKYCVKSTQHGQDTK